MSWDGKLLVEHVLRVFERKYYAADVDNLVLLGFEEAKIEVCDTVSPCIIELDVPTGRKFSIKVSPEELLSGWCEVNGVEYRYNDVRAAGRLRKVKLRKEEDDARIDNRIYRNLDRSDSVVDLICSRAVGEADRPFPHELVEAVVQYFQAFLTESDHEWVDEELANLEADPNTITMRSRVAQDKFEAFQWFFVEALKEIDLVTRIDGLVQNVGHVRFDGNLPADGYEIRAGETMECYVRLYIMHRAPAIRRMDLVVDKTLGEGDFYVALGRDLNSDWLQMQARRLELRFTGPS